MKVKPVKKMLENKSCKFCEQLRRAKECSEYYASKRPSIKEDCATKCTVALVDNHYYRGEFNGRTTYGFDELNFCPSCGRSIVREEIEW